MLASLGPTLASTPAAAPGPTPALGPTPLISSRDTDPVVGVESEVEVATGACLLLMAFVLCRCR